MWTRYEVTMDFLTKLCGSVPGDPKLVEIWLKQRLGEIPKTRPADFKSISEIATEVIEAQPEEVQGSILTFQRQEGGLVVRLGTIRSHLKDCARIVSSLYVGKLEGEKSFAVRVINGIYYPPDVYWISIRNQLTGGIFQEPSGTYDKPVHAMTPRGPTNSLKRIEYVEGARLIVPLIVLTPKKGKPIIDDEDLNSLFEYGGTHGYGGERGDGEGRYVATVKRLEA